MTKIPFRLYYQKTGYYRFLSHLDLYRLYSRALRRADLPVWFSQGYHPRPKLSFPKAYPVGQQVCDAEMTLYLTEPMDIQDIINRLNKQLPAEVMVYEVSKG